MKIAIFTGPRTISAQDENLVQEIVREVVERGFKIYVGDADGVDSQIVYAAMEVLNFPRVFCPIELLGRTPAGLAERSTRMVKEALRDAAGDELLCIGFPNRACPAEIVPAKSWKSGGSGTWSTLALSVGLGIETWMFPLGEGHEAPYWCSSIDSFDCYKTEHITFYARHFTPAPSLFKVQS